MATLINVDASKTDQPLTSSAPLSDTLSERAQLLYNILLNKRQDLPKFLETNGSFGTLIGLLKEIEMKTPGDNILNKLLLGTSNAVDKIKELPTTELIDVIYIISNIVNTKDQVEICEFNAGSGILSYLLSKKIEEDKNSIKVSITAYENEPQKNQFYELKKMTLSDYINSSQIPNINRSTTHTSIPNPVTTITSTPTPAPTPTPTPAPAIITASGVPPRVPVQRTPATRSNYTQVTTTSAQPPTVHATLQWRVANRRGNDNPWRTSTTSSSRSISSSTRGQATGTRSQVTGTTRGQSTGSTTNTTTGTTTNVTTGATVGATISSTIGTTISSTTGSITSSTASTTTGATTGSITSSTASTTTSSSTGVTASTTTTISAPTTTRICIITWPERDLEQIITTLIQRKIFDAILIIGETHERSCLSGTFHANLNVLLYSIVVLPVKQLCHLDYFKDDLARNNKCCRSCLTVLLNHNFGFLIPTIQEICGQHNFMESLMEHITDREALQELVIMGLLPQWIGKITDALTCDRISVIVNKILKYSIKTTDNKLIPFWLPENDVDILLFWYRKTKTKTFPVSINTRERVHDYYTKVLSVNELYGLTRSKINFTIPMWIDTVRVAEMYLNMYFNSREDDREWTKTYEGFLDRYEDSVNQPRYIDAY